MSIERGMNRRALLLGALGGVAIASLSEAAPALAPPESALMPGPITPILGPANGTRVLAVFFDYHCPFCRRMDPLLPQLAHRNPQLQILFKEFPVLREDSQVAARIALSAQLRGRYFEVHDELMKHQGDYTGALATDIARRLGVDPDAFRRDMGHPDIEQELAANFREANSAGIQATPGLVSAAGVQQGFRTLAQLQALVGA